MRLRPDQKSVLNEGSASGFRRPALGFSGLVSALLFLGVGCSSPRSEGEPAAPTSATTAGILIRVSTAETASDLEQTLRHSTGLELRVRSLDPTSGRFEIQGASNAPRSVQDLETREQIFRALRSLSRLSLLEFRPNLFEVLVPPQPEEKPWTISDCALSRISRDTLKVVVRVAGKSIADGATAIALTDRDEVEVRAYPTLRLERKLRWKWTIRGPGGEPITPGITTESDLETLIRFIPTTPGAYSANVIAAESDDSIGSSVPGSLDCHTAGVRFGATWNPEIPRDAETPAPYDPQTLARDFSHLAQIQAPSAWAKSRGQGARIAVIDSGAALDHPDLASHLAVNVREIPGNGMDDDGNGFVDDVYGWDFANSDSNPSDDSGHGTHVAGLALSSRTGVAPEAQLLAIKALNLLGGADLGSLDAAVRYAVNQGAQIINLSLGSASEDFKRTFEPALQYAAGAGVLIVASAGNGDLLGTGQNTDLKPIYPASIETCPLLLSVAASELSGALARYSNYGVRTVHLAAPGGSDLDGGLRAPGYLWKKSGLYELRSGTSMATPLVTGALALVRSASPTAPALELRRRLLEGSLESPALKGRTQSGRLLNVYGPLLTR